MRRESQEKAVLKELIDDAVKKAEARRNKVDVTEKQIRESLEKMAKGSNTSIDGLSAKLKEKGVALSTLKRFVEAQIIMRWLMGKESDKQIEADAAEVDRRLQQIEADPRLKPVQLYEIVQVELPVEQSSGAMAQQLMYARAVEAQQLAQRYKGCGSLRSAAEGIFNVKIGQPVQALADKMPAEMKQALDQAGTKRMIGPIPGSTGIRMIAFCGRKQVAPPKPSREMVENLVLNEKYAAATERIMRELRRKSFIDYKDASLR